MFGRKKTANSNSSSIRKEKIKNAKENQVQYFSRSKSVDLESKSKLINQLYCITYTE